MIAHQLDQRAAIIFRGAGENHWRRACQEIGFEITTSLPLDEVASVKYLNLGPIILIACGPLSEEDRDHLSIINAKAREADAKIVAIIDEASIDTAFACLTLERTQFLLEPDRTEFAASLFHAVVANSDSSTDEIQNENNSLLRQLAAHIETISARLFSTIPVRENEDFIVKSFSQQSTPDQGRDCSRKSATPLPDPRFLRQLIQNRRLRDRYFPGQWFSDPAWDVLLDLLAARSEHRRVSISSLCVAAAVPTTTALRWIQDMCDKGLLVREPDPQDKRRVFVALSEPVARSMSHYFDEVGNGAAVFL